MSDSFSQLSDQNQFLRGCFFGFVESLDFLEALVNDLLVVVDLFDGCGHLGSLDLFDCVLAMRDLFVDVVQLLFFVDYVMASL